ncbi:MAG TPA: uroporphyrinogen-III synthase, partial [Gemmatales bacterium]|nr:uroporphyrinogen-III synthase [Gemmatales bacterium]
MGTGSATGVVYLVGAGPGDPEWLTLSGADCLARADAIYFDQELPARLLDRAPRTAARFAVGSANVADLLIGAAVDGRTVVRLHAGAADPRSAAGEEMKCLRRAGVPFELIPGVGTAPPEALRCFMTRALSGVSILVTRPSSQAETLAAPLERLGAKVCRWPLIEIGPAPEPAAIEDVLRRLRDFAWLAFTSAAGVDAFMQALTDCPGADVRWLGHLRLAAIGPKTAGALKKYRLRADVVPAAFDSEHLAAALLPAVRGQSV